MGRKRSPGLRLRGGTWYVDKVIFGQRVVETTRTGDLQEAERYLAHRIEEIRRAEVYGIRPKRPFKEAAAKYLRENMEQRSIGDEASRLKGLLPFIGELPLTQIHDGTLAAYVNDCKKKGLKNKTVNNGLEVVRRILNLAARKWRDERGLTWLETPPLLTMLDISDARSPYPLGWDEQKFLLRALPDHLAQMALFKVNTGTREQEACNLRWDWEIQVPELDTPVFLIPRDIVKNKEDRLVVLNRVAASVVEAQRGRHHCRVFTFRARTDRWNLQQRLETCSRSGCASLRLSASRAGIVGFFAPTCPRPEALVRSPPPGRRCAVRNKESALGAPERRHYVALLGA